jgi:hypothetical protein
MPIIFDVDYAPLQDLDKPEHRDIPLDSIVVDERVQREVLPTKLDTITAEFCWPGIDARPVVVSRRGGKYIVLDGQHRTLAVERQNLRPGTKEHTIGAMVYENLTLEQEALLFLLLNNQSKVHAASTFNVLVTAGVASAVEVNAVITRHGLRVGSNNKQFTAVGAALRIARWPNGLSTLNTTLDILTRAFPDPIGVNRPWQESILSAVARIVHRYGESIDADRFVRMLQDRYPQDDASIRIRNAGQALMAANRASLTLNIAGALVTHYNNAVPKAAKVHPWDPDAEAKNAPTKETLEAEEE